MARWLNDNYGCDGGDFGLEPSWLDEPSFVHKIDASSPQGFPEGSISVKDLARGWAKSEKPLLLPWSAEEGGFLVPRRWAAPPQASPSPWAVKETDMDTTSGRQLGSREGVPTYRPGEVLLHNASPVLKPASPLQQMASMPPWPSLAGPQAALYPGLQELGGPPGLLGMESDGSLSTADTSPEVAPEKTDLGYMRLPAAFGIPTKGSVGHPFQCKPCAFMYKSEQGGCKSGYECAFCHLCVPGEKKRRKKAWRGGRQYRAY
jgi:hypothetical protein